jgi:hypothetical protein
VRANFFLTLGVVLLTAAEAIAKKEPVLPAPLGKEKQLALVRVNVTGQPYDYFRPWQKKAPQSKRALGAVLSKGRVLVTADLVANQNYVELERAESGEKSAANVQVVDYESNLAVLEPTEKNFLNGITPLDIATDTVVGDRWARHHHSDDTLPGRYWRVSHLPRQHFDAISREQLHHSDS